MSKNKQVIIEVDKDGNCSINGEGFVGPECAHFIKEIEQSLGEKISQIDKPEYVQRRTIQQRHKQTGGSM